MQRAITGLSALVLTSAIAAGQTGTLDQDNTSITNVSDNMAFAPFVYGQVVEVGTTGVLEGIMLRVSGYGTVTPNLPVKLFEWDQSTLTQGAQLWSGGVPATNLSFFTNEFIDLTASNIVLDSGDFFLIEVGDAAANLTGWGLSLNQGWNQANSMFVATYPHDHYQDGVYDPFIRLVFQTWMLEANLGASYCASNPNSTGSAAGLHATGTPTVSQNNLTLAIEDLPPSSFSFFLTGRTRGFVPQPVGSEGNLCLGGSIGRYVGPGQIQQAGPDGVISLVLRNSRCQLRMASSWPKWARPGTSRAGTATRSAVRRRRTSRTESRSSSSESPSGLAQLCVTWPSWE